MKKHYIAFTLALTVLFSSCFCVGVYATENRVEAQTATIATVQAENIDTIDEYDEYTDYEESEGSGAKKYLIAIGISLAISLVIVFSMKAKMKNIAFVKQAQNYVKDGSFNLSQSRDIYLYSHTSRTKKPEKEDD